MIIKYFLTTSILFTEYAILFVNCKAKVKKNNPREVHCTSDTKYRCFMLNRLLELINDVALNIVVLTLFFQVLVMRQKKWFGSLVFFSHHPNAPCNFVEEKRQFFGIATRLPHKLRFLSFRSLFLWMNQLQCVSSIPFTKT